MHTVILVPNNEATAQMRRSLLRLPGHATSFPSVVDHGPHGTDYFFVLEWFPGGTLENYLKRVRSGKTPRPSPTECMRLFRGLAHSLRMLHEIAQVIHGDLKPANLVLTTRPSSLRLIDFGSSWPLQRTSVRLRGDGADPVFQAPEFFLEGVLADPRSDQFSLGVNLYLMLTMTVPFGGLGGKIGHEDFRDSFQKNSESLVPPSELVSFKENIPTAILKELDRVVLRLLQIDPQDRFQDSRQCSNAFDAFAALVQISESHKKLSDVSDTSQDGLLKRFWKWLQV